MNQSIISPTTKLSNNAMTTKFTARYEKKTSKNAMIMICLKEGVMALRIGWMRRRIPQFQHSLKITTTLQASSSHEKIYKFASISMYLYIMK